jgi:hypothetical protein
MGFETQWVQKIFLQTVSGTQPVSYWVDRPSGVLPGGNGMGAWSWPLTVTQRLKLTAHRYPALAVDRSPLSSAWSWPLTVIQRLKLTTHRYPAPRLNMSGAINLLLHTPLWCGEGQLPIIVCVCVCSERTVMPLMSFYSCVQHVRYLGLHNS